MEHNNSKSKYVDIHSHPLKEYYPDPDAEVIRWYKEDVGVVLATATSRNEFAEISQLVDRHKHLFGVYGIHPNVATGEADGEYLRQNISDQAVAVGEIGLDLYYDDNPSEDTQIRSLLSQLEVAQELRLPVVIHCRNAFYKLWEIVSHDKYLDINFVFHTFSEGLREAELLMSRPNMWISVSGVVTFKNADKTREVAASIPLDRLFVETDSPYLTPAPHRGSQNTSDKVRFVYEKIAQIREITVTDVIKRVRENVRYVFRI